MPSRGEAFDFLNENAARIFGTSVGSMLYVGHRHDTHPWWHRTFAPLVGASRLAVIDVIEENMRTASSVTDELYHGDVRNHSLVPTFGLVFWDEGPEHLPREEALDLIRELHYRHGRVLISCPWGFMQQGFGPNDPEFHHWGPLPADFEAIGMTARTFGVQFPEGHGNLIAWI